MCNKTMEIDVIGQYYTSINNHKYPGVFALTVQLKEAVKLQILQKAANDLMRRLPFLNGRLKYGFFHYEYEPINELAQIEPDGKEPLICDYYNKGRRHMIKIVYGQKHFTVKTTHSICDGRGLSKFLCALIVRYFELLGLDFDKDGIIDCNEKFNPEEAEDASKMFTYPPSNTNSNKNTWSAKVYRIKAGRDASQKFITKVFEMDKIKKAAKEYDVTISQYILAHIFCVIAQKRDNDDESGSITGNVQIDCRSFFPSKTLRSFVTSATVKMPEEKDFSQMVNEVKNQFYEITKESVQEQLYEYQKMYQGARFVPRAIKDLAMKIIARKEAGKSTTGISNLGIIKLPAIVENHIDRVEFPIAIEKGYSNFFSCVTIGNKLTITATFREEGRVIALEVLAKIGAE